MTYDFDLFVIGGGSAGVRCGRIAAGHGARVAVAESRFWGGTCVNVGCVPKKFMVQAAEYGGWIQDAPAFGWNIPPGTTHDWARLASARDTEVARLSGIYATLLGNAGVTTLEGYASFAGPHAVEVNGTIYTAATIVIAVGGQPVRPGIPGVDLALVSDDLFTLPALPKQIAVIGAGYIALEFAMLLRGLGAEVDLIHRSEMPLRGFDQDIREAVCVALDHAGIRRHGGLPPLAIEAVGERRLVHLSDSHAIETDAVMLATGRMPNLAGLKLEAAGLAADKRGALSVNAAHQTAVPHIYAIGDVIDRVALTPMATAVGHALADTLFGGNPRQASYLNVPSAVFTDPPIASVGLTEEQAAATGLTDIYVSRFTPMRHTITKNGRRTLMKLVVDARTQKVLGAHMMGEDAAEMMQGIAIAITAGATKQDFDRTIGIHPTAAEEFVTMRTRTRQVGVP
ncbi:NADPH-glutathione reductase [Humitalea rosea]|uniref:NADPH-glutathione reductase n=1 Tax=Humitalea rosea TaxID=990373 RepID=A0A2W7I584_9PROT|nr:glutathione-disulfide reductase [Humitalea rosea]PZW41359.1 NADPH-glutathione reductase [Humitalea rosea]